MRPLLSSVLEEKQIKVHLVFTNRLQAWWGDMTHTFEVVDACCLVE